jgi:hypothetical protein
MDHSGIGSKRVLDGDHSRKRVVVDINELAGVFGHITTLCQRHRYGLSDVGGAFGGE